MRPALPSAAGAGQYRLLFIDNIRWTMIVLVVSMHACVTYSPFGSWYYREPSVMGLGTMLGFAFYQAFLQAFFMALLFFIAGYFAGASLDRKGLSRFVRDRFARLGLPTLLYMLVIGPLTQYFLSHSWGRGGFARQWAIHIENGQWLSETGPMWFCAALLGFSVAYGLLRQCGLKEARIAPPGGRSGDIAVIGFVAAMAAATFLVRLVEPEGRAVLNMQLGDFPQYVLMFGAGLFAYRGGWLEALEERFCMRWGIGALLLAGPLFCGLVLLGGTSRENLAEYAGGFNLVSAGKCLWEALVCVGISLLVIATYRRFLDRQGKLARLLSENAFGIYLIHPPVLIGFALLLHRATLDAAPKAAALTLLAAAGSLAVSALILRRAPLLRAIV
jgi:fucose 4-O-acetylase-like acetyltransferase